MGSQGQQLHIFVFPLMAPGHLLPAVDIAKLFAAKGVRVSIITTAGEERAIETSLCRSTEAGHRVRTLLVEWSSSAVGLPDNLSSVKTPDMHMDFLVSTPALRPSFERLVKNHRPAAIVTDMFFPWTAEVAEEVRIPRLVFHGTSFFYLCIKGKLNLAAASQESHTDSGDRFVIPGIPHRIELIRSQVIDTKRLRPDFADMLMKIMEAEGRSYGTVVNSFYELEPDYADHYRNVIGRKAWHIGPVFLRNEDAADNAVRGGKCAVDQAIFSRWLDSKAASSVLYVCFGSLSRFKVTQVREIAAGLESSGHPFIWVVKNSGQGNSSGQWLPEGFEERVAESGMGMIIRGWAPQVLILNHVAIGGFLTHCGWNSSLESVSAGLPVVTWPMFADQFCNERMLVDMLKVGVEIGVKTCSLVEEERDAVKAEEIASAVGRLMGDSPEAEERRRRARELKAAARGAVEEGGSSYKDLARLIQELSGQQSTASHVRT
ncbi:unnamed protein product [Spirodela intermedia]|uniref:Glycosyltransferase n=1 Tax=Spirodela intermedia TaxID=51605 RepID=A0A7I8IT72_SPIIN|nr:unnamed protein product [Spirodela intermedia]CAA6661204.1 unnamed protein product [Spirodela intermedia]